MNLSRLVAYNTLVQIFAKAVTVIFGIITTAFLTNYLGPRGFGDYVFALSFVAIFSAVADWGTVLIGVREASRHEEKQGQLFANILLLRFVLSFIATLVSWLVVAFFPFSSTNPETLFALRRLVILSSSLILLFNLKTSLGIIFQTKLKMDRAALVDASASFLTLIFSFVVIKTSGSTSLFIAAILLANIFALNLAFLLVRGLTDLNFSPSFYFIRRITFEALPMGGTLIIYSIYNRLDTLILQAVKGSDAVGVYGLSYRIYEVLILGAFYLMNSLFPVIAKESNHERLRQFYQKTLDLLILGGLFVAVGTFLLAPLAVKVVALKRVGEFSQSIPLLRILGLATFISYLNHLTGYTIITLGKQHRYLIISLVALFFNLIANLLLIPHFSFFAAAWITVLTEGLVFCLTSLLIARVLKFTPSFFSFPKTAWEIIRRRGRVFD